VSDTNDIVSPEKKVEKAAPGLAKTFSLVAIFTLASKFVGLARDSVVSHAFGQGLITDAYNYAYTITGTVLVLFGGQGGPFHSASLTTLINRKDDPDLSKLVMQMLVWTALITGLLALLVYWQAPLLGHWLASGEANALTGYSTHERWLEITKQVKIMSPIIMISGLVGIGCGISNTYHEHFWPSIAPAVASVAIIAFVMAPHTDGGVALATGTLVGAIGQLLVQIPGILKAHPSFSFDIFTRMQPGLKQYLTMLLPLTFSTSIGQLIGYVDQTFASSLMQGGWSAICNANRLIQLPLGILVTAMLVPIGPIFAKHVAAGKIDTLKFELKRALTLLWFLALPMSALLFVEGKQVVMLLFERGAFGPKDTAMVVSVINILVPMIFFYVARDLITRVFYAFEDSRTPFIVAIVAIAVKFLLDWLFVVQLQMGIVGIGLATTLITIFNLTVLFYFLRKKTGRLGAMAMLRSVVIMVSAAAVCGVIAWLLTGTLQQTLQTLITQLVPWFAYIKDVVIALNLAISSAAALAAYTVICYMLRLEELHLVAERIKVKLKLKKAEE
jgi:putative peptidoglycan lipid II flippase